MHGFLCADLGVSTRLPLGQQCPTQQSVTFVCSVPLIQKAAGLAGLWLLCHKGLFRRQGWHCVGRVEAVGDGVFWQLTCV